jgi:hypothetical protein
LRAALLALVLNENPLWIKRQKVHSL